MQFTAYPSHITIYGVVNFYITLSFLAYFLLVGMRHNLSNKRRADTPEFEPATVPGHTLYH